MSRKKLFYSGTNISGKNFKFPVESVLFLTEEAQFFVYALYTKSDFTKNKLVEVDYDEYIRIKKLLNSLLGHECAEISCINKQVVEFMTNLVRYKTLSDTLTVGEALDLNIL